MTGRGIDQILTHPGDPTLYESWVKSATDYVSLAERRHGPIPRRVDPTYIWGEALDVLEERDVDLRLINLETAVTVRGEPWPGKGIHYRMDPANVDCITAARIDCCVLANNHVLDWSEEGLAQTLTALDNVDIARTGAGRDRTEAWAPADIHTDTGRVLTLGMGMTSSGIPGSWKAGTESPGVALAGESVSETIDLVSASMGPLRRGTDVVVVSIHWGPNWGYHIAHTQRELAHRLIEEAGADVVHGHSSHHPIGIEVHRGRPILYGCGDLINDYEGIGGHEEFRSDLRALYLVTLGTDGLHGVELIPMRTEGFRLTRANREEAMWMARQLSDVSAEFGSRLEAGAEGTLALRW